jgi:hypothetical protein
MKRNFASVALCAGFGLGLTAVCFAQAEPSSTQGGEAQVPAEQARLAQATYNLENAFREQFVQGKIDRAALSDHISDVVQAMPEAARPTVQAHIDQVLQAGAQAALQMTPEQRVQASAPPSEEKIGKSQAAWVGAWGWPGYGGFGGYGAFGFPSMYTFGTGCGLGWGACGYGNLGMGGWFW